METQFDFEKAKEFIDSFKELVEAKFDETDLPVGRELVKKYYNSVDNMAKCMTLIENIDREKTDEKGEATMHKALAGYIRHEAFYKEKMEVLIELYK